MYQSTLQTTMLTNILLLLFSATLIDVSYCECIQSYITKCDDFEDFDKLKEVENISDLMIGSDYKNITPTAVNLMFKFNLNKFNKLTSLTILYAINQLQRTYGFQCRYESSPLKYVNFYGNELGTIEGYHFPILNLKKLSLVNNKIEAVKNDAFTHQKIENIDLSDNLLEVIESQTLPQTEDVKIITIKNNKLTHIDANSFPSNLQSLNLDKNNLRYIQNEVLQSLNLRELTLSHNKFHEIPKIDHMDNLIIFDISFNSIRTIRNGTFRNMKNLTFLDLSNNKIVDGLILEWVHTPINNNGFTINLAFNGLRDLNLENVSLEEKTLILYGNPWDCKTSTKLKTKLYRHESECDVEFASTGNTPLCFDFVLGEYFLNNKWPEDIKRFREAVRKSSKSAKCDLIPDRYNSLYPITYGCVA